MSKADIVNHDAPVVIGIRRSGANGYPNNAYFVVPTTDPDEENAPIRAGDLCVVVDMGRGNPSAPTHVVPIGWTDMGTTTGTNDLGEGMRLSIYRKILTSADIGATFQGVIPTAPKEGRKMVCTFRLNRPAQTSTYHAGWGLGPNAGGGSYACGPTNGYSGGTFILLGVALGDNTIYDYNYNWNGVTPRGSSYLNPPNAYGQDHIGPGAGAVGSATRSFYESVTKFDGALQNVTQCNVSDMGLYTYSALLVLSVT